MPLQNAHLSGGWAWSSEKKEEYANYLGSDIVGLEPDDAVAANADGNLKPRSNHPGFLYEPGFFS